MVNSIEGVARLATSPQIKLSDRVTRLDHVPFANLTGDAIPLVLAIARTSLPDKSIFRFELPTTTTL
jgi:hypothetical protein